MEDSGIESLIVKIKNNKATKHWVLYGNVESLSSIPETNTALYSNWDLSKKLKGKHTKTKQKTSTL